jgi:hypothetical protein
MIWSPRLGSAAREAFAGVTAGFRGIGVVNGELQRRTDRRREEPRHRDTALAVDARGKTSDRHPACGRTEGFDGGVMRLCGRTSWCLDSGAGAD